jgi:hypothetical protein
MILNPLSVATRGYVPLAAIALATAGYVQLDDTLIADGGYTLGGAAVFSVVTTVTPDGGLSFGGAATIEYLPPTGGEARRMWYRLGLGF